MTCLHGLVGQNAGLYSMDKNTRHVLFRSEGKLGQLVIDTHELAIGALCLFISALAVAPVSTAFIIVGGVMVYRSISKYDQSIWGDVQSSTKFIFNSLFK